jgi:hypothetical protein
VDGRDKPGHDDQLNYARQAAPPILLFAAPLRLGCDQALKPIGEGAGFLLRKLLSHNFDGWFHAHTYRNFAQGIRSWRIEGSSHPSVLKLIRCIRKKICLLTCERPAALAAISRRTRVHDVIAGSTGACAILRPREFSSRTTVELWKFGGEF